MSDSGERIHEATPQRLQAAHAEGDIAKSFELAASLSILGAIAAAYLTFAQIGNWLSVWTMESWQRAGHNIDASSLSMVKGTQSLIYATVGVLLPFLLMVFFVAMASHWTQTGPIWLPGLLSPKASRLGPSRWLGQIKLSRIMSSTVLGLPKIVVGFAVMLTGLWGNRVALMSLANDPADVLVQDMFALVVRISLMVVVALLLLGGIDFAINWFAHRRRHMMTEQEMRDENRMQEGDSVSRSRQRQLDRV